MWNNTIKNHGFFKRFKLTNLLFWLVDMSILTKGQGLEWHIYLLTNQLDYNVLFYKIHNQVI